VLDTSILIAAERKDVKPDELIENVRTTVDQVPIVLSSLSVAEIGHGIYRAHSLQVRRRRREFLDELKATLPILPLPRRLRKSLRVSGENLPKKVKTFR